MTLGASIKSEKEAENVANDPYSPLLVLFFFCLLIRRSFNWPLRQKWIVTLTACYVTFTVGINSTSITAAAQAINERFDVSDATFPNSFWPVTAWNGGAAVAPMLVLPILEEHGMRNGYLICYALFTLFVIPQAFAQNFATLIVSRFIAGCAGGVLQDVMDGIIADVWPGAEQRSLPVTVYVFALLAGVSIGPVVGGAVTSHLYWRWMFYIQLIVYGVSSLLVFFCFKETRGAVIAAKAASNLSLQESHKDRTKRHRFSLHSIIHFLNEAVVLPTRLLCTEPVVFFFTLLSSLSYGLVFVATQSVAQVYQTLYGWSEYQTGLVQTSLVVGEALGLLACLPQNALYARRARSSTAPSQSTETTVAESRLYLSVPGSFLGLTGGMFWYGWTSSAERHWILPTVGLAWLGFGVMTVMQAIMMYVTDAYEKYAGSASAAVCFGENLFAAFLPLAAMSMYTNLGFAWASSIMAFVALVLSFAPVVLIWKGQAIRKRSPFIQEAQYGT